MEHFKAVTSHSEMLQDGRIVEVPVHYVMETGLLGQLEGADVFVPKSQLPPQPNGRMGTLQVSNSRLALVCTQ